MEERQWSPETQARGAPSPPVEVGCNRTGTRAEASETAQGARRNPRLKGGGRFCVRGVGSFLPQPSLKGPCWPSLHPLTRRAGGLSRTGGRSLCLWLFRPPRACPPLPPPSHKTLSPASGHTAGPLRPLDSFLPWGSVQLFRPLAAGWGLCPPRGHRAGDLQEPPTCFSYLVAPLLASQASARQAALPPRPDATLRPTQSSLTCCKATSLTPGYPRFLPAGLVHCGLRGTMAELAEDRGWTCGGPPPHPGTHHWTGPFFSTCLWPPSRIGLRPSPDIQRGKGPQRPGHSTPAPSSPESLHSHGDALHTFPRDRPDHDSGPGPPLE
ncbi:Hypothetical predicted protein [Marmota monax]|uniref:Uncharacterized protein n=1 Tax=Marmota monax TaxID=9995 RepID=A0A5E4CHV4_MARMO|nr:Hypothetical predicted protein [Marmota monax]